MSDVKLVNPNAWNFASWQNFSVLAAFMLWTLWIALRDGRTPLELLTPPWDRRIVSLLRRRRSADNVSA
jgi:hypothetical protein